MSGSAQVLPLFCGGFAVEYQLAGIPLWPAPLAGVRRGTTVVDGPAER